VLSSQGRTSLESSAYTAYGHDAATDAQTLLGFNGERRNRMPALYLLGNGYRAYSTVLGRFTSPDSWSPFGDGGINSYCYCSGDPVNFIDPSGHGLTYADGRFFVFKKNTIRQVQVRPLHDAGLSQRAAIFAQPGQPPKPPRHAGVTREPQASTALRDNIAVPGSQPPEGKVAVSVRNITRYVTPEQVPDTERMLTNHFTLQGINPLLKHIPLEQLGPQTRALFTAAVKEQRELIAKLRQT